MIFKRRVNDDSDTQGSVLLMQVPRTNEKKELAAEQLFASLHGLLQSTDSAFKTLYNERVSFEIAVKDKRIGFYVWVPTHLKSFVEDQIYAQYPTVQISEVDDYTQNASSAETQLIAELRLSANEALPIKTFPSFEVDPLAAITAALAQFDDNEEAWIQLVLGPAPDDWYKKSEKYAANLRGQGGGQSLLGQILAPSAKPAAAPKLAEFQTTQAAAVEEKSHKLAYEVCLRIVYRGNTALPQGRMRLQAITASFKQFNTTYLNGFSQRYLGTNNLLIDLFKKRSFSKNQFVCNIEEIASLYHLPHTNVETPNILWASAKTAEPPANLPLINDAMPEVVRAELSPIAVTNFRGGNAMFGLPRSDRSRHLYILGQTGVGKSGLLELLTISDIFSPYGFAVIDPHGDYAINILKRIPEHRVKDVIYFNPADTDYPIAFNPMEVYDPKLKTHTCSELIGVLKRIFESWGPRLEYILRYSILALLDYPDSTMLDITRILTDDKFRKDVISHILDPVVKNFWTVEFASWNGRFATEAVAPVLNKVGAFTANPVVRNIIGQPKSSFNIREIMDQRKILIVNLSRGLIGEDNAALLGALLVTKMQMAAMSRADIEDIDQRIPFYLYVDEFQNFATDSFTTILSEARKYALILTVANQYIAQMTPGVKDAVFGNVGSIISFRMSADDARTMVKYFEPHFSDYDLIHIHNRHFAVNMTIDGEKVQAFSGTTLNLPDSSTNFSAEIIKNSREQFSYKRVDIEDIMHERYNPEFVRRTLQEINDAPKATSPVSDTPKAEPDKVSHNPTVKVETPKKPLATILRPADAIKRLGFLANNLSEEKEEKPAANKLVDQPTIIKSQPEQPKIQQSEPSEDQALVNPLTSPNKRRRRNRKRPNKEVVMSVPVPTAQPGEVQELGEDNIISLR
jgi:hypothetical protein